jgi:BolA protein
MEKTIKQKLEKEFSPEFLEVKNNSYLHQGHAGDDGSGNTHFAITIKSEKLKAMSRVNAHRAVKNALLDEFKKGLHALEIKIL